MKAHVLKHTVCAPNDITVLPPANHSTCAKRTVCAPNDITVLPLANQSTCAKANRVCQPLCCN